mmetsp:Transcript_7037/g.25034  ORF Transcript_7037/g.25034 Transcript_7037/m.25034 type:complete len:302 (-) Transcript_7037:151-1056(-)
MPTRSGKRRNFLTRVTSCVAFTLGTVGSVLMIVSAGQLSDMPAMYLCQQQGYGASDCTSQNQTWFELSSTPPCCLGAPNASVAWSRDPFVDIVQSTILVSCKDRSTAYRAQIQWKNPTAKYSQTALDTYEMLSLRDCERDKTLSKFYFLWQPGVIAAIAVVLSAGAHASGVSWVAAVGNMVGTANIAVISSAISIAQSLDTQTGIECRGLPPDLVKEGKFMDTYTCFDVTIGGIWADDPGYDYLRSATRNYYAAAVLVLLSVATYAGLVAEKLTRRADQRSKRMMREVVRDRAWFEEPLAA